MRNSSAQVPTQGVLARPKLAWLCTGRGFVLCAAMLGVRPATALAHPVLRHSTPAAHAILTHAPTVITLSFSEPLELALSRVRLQDIAGNDIRIGPLAANSTAPRTLTAKLSGSLPPGDYAIRWLAAGADGHVERGEIAFTVAGAPALSPIGGAASAGVIPPGSSGAHPQRRDATANDRGVFDATSPVFVALRWLMYLSLLGIIGAVVFQGVVLNLIRRTGGDSGRRLAATLFPAVAGIGLATTMLLLLSLPGRLIAQSFAMHDRGDAADLRLPLAILRHTIWGWSWLAQLGAGVVALAGFERARRGTGSWVPIRAAAIVLAFTPAFAGHAIAAERWAPLAVLGDGLHVLGAAGWLGTLGFLVFVGLVGALRLPANERGPAAADLVNAFSPVALVCAGTIAATGALAAWIHIGHVSDVWTTRYGRILLLKLGILAIVVGTGAYNWRWVRPTLGDELGLHRIRRSAMVELGVAVAVLLVTAVLVALPTPMGLQGP